LAVRSSGSRKCITRMEFAMTTGQKPGVVGTWHAGPQEVVSLT
jgi:hypothetical protein